MLSFRVVENLDVVEQLLSGSGAGLVGSPLYPFSLNGAPQKLEHCHTASASGGKEFDALGRTVETAERASVP